MTKNNKTLFSIVITLLVAGFIVASIIQGISIKQDEKTIKISGGLFYSTTVNKSDIISVELSDNVNFGKRTNGMGGFSVNAGHFSNSQFGDYSLYVYTKVQKYIVIAYKENSVIKTVVFNCKSLDETESTGHELKNM